MRKIKDKIIKLLGGYTRKDYIHVERKYQCLLDSNTKNKTPQIVNEYLFRQLRDLDYYARNTLYGINPEIWAKKMYNVIHNNYSQLAAAYLYVNSTVIYKTNLTLDDDKQYDFSKMNYDANEDIYVLETD